MSLYTSVYWTKRVLVVFSLIIFVCGGIRLFQFVSSALTKTDSQISGQKAEAGFGKLDKITFNPITKNNFSPTEFRISTTKGNLDADNLYPADSEQTPLANVYRIIEQPIDLGTTEEPVAIGRKLGFTKVPQEITSTERKWSEGTKDLDIDGQYKLISYSNSGLKTERQSVTGNVSVTDSSQLQGYFTKVITDLGISTSLTGYTFSAEYLDYNKTLDSFVPSTSTGKGQYIRISAKRFYPNLVKINDKATSRATYPNYNFTNNYFIVPNSAQLSFQSATDLVELKLFNWPLNQEIAALNPNVQTYAIKTPREAYAELSQNKGALVALYESGSKKNADIGQIEDVKLVDILSVRLDMYEAQNYTRYIQPVYLFLCEVTSSGLKYQLAYYVPALLDSNYN